MGRAVKVILADDHNVVRVGFRHLLENSGGIRVVAEAENGADCIELYRTHTPDLVIMDLAMSPMDGLEAMQRILALDPAARILMLSYRKEAVFAERALAEGARGYLSKSAAPDLLLAAIDQVLRGEKFIDPAIAQSIALRHVSSPDGNPFSSLTGREFAVFLQLAEGKKHAVIAGELNVSENTVSTYSHRIKRKLGVSDRAGLIKLALSHQLLTP